MSCNDSAGIPESQLAVLRCLREGGGDDEIREARRVIAVIVSEFPFEQSGSDTGGARPRRLSVTGWLDGWNPTLKK